MVPVTSISLLKVLGEDSQSPRWREFLRMYASTIDGFLFKHFPTVDAEDVVQETLRALVEKLPLYEYEPDTKGHFRNYLIGIVRFKAIEQLKRRKREADLRVELEANAQFEWECEKQSYSVDLRDWQREAYEAALAQFMADKNISTRDKEIFRRVALQGESPEDVAAIFDIKRNNKGMDRNYSGTNHLSGHLLTVPAHDVLWTYQIPRREWQENDNIDGEKDQNP